MINNGGLQKIRNKSYGKGFKFQTSLVSFFLRRHFKVLQKLRKTKDFTIILPELDKNLFQSYWRKALNCGWKRKLQVKEILQTMGNLIRFLNTNGLESTEFQWNSDWSSFQFSPCTRDSFSLFYRFTLVRLRVVVFLCFFFNQIMVNNETITYI